MPCCVPARLGVLGRTSPGSGFGSLPLSVPSSIALTWHCWGLPGAGPCTAPLYCFTSGVASCFLSWGPEASSDPRKCSPSRPAPFHRTLWDICRALLLPTLGMSHGQLPAPTLGPCPAERRSAQLCPSLLQVSANSGIENKVSEKSSRTVGAASHSGGEGPPFPWKAGCS